MNRLSLVPALALFVPAILFLSFLPASPAQAQSSSKPVLLPSQFIQGERIYLKMATASGDTVLGYCDSGGGFTAIYPDVVDKLQLQAAVQQTMVDSTAYSSIPFAAVVKDKDIAPTVTDPSTPFITTPSFTVPSKAMMQGEIGFVRKFIPHDAFLGQFFFLGKAWTFDYIHQQVWVNTPLSLADSAAPGVEKLGFKKNAEGKKTNGHPSMTIVVEGETIDVLFDIGASLILSPNGKQALNTTESSAGGSFIARSIGDKWHTQHPDWTYVEKAELNGMPMIRVPLLTIVGRKIGPVWFSMRPDAVWSQMMIHSMDKVVKGAIGGSAFKYLKVTIDYNNELVKFE